MMIVFPQLMAGAPRYTRSLISPNRISLQKRHSNVKAPTQMSFLMPIHVRGLVSFQNNHPYSFLDIRSIASQTNQSQNAQSVMYMSNHSCPLFIPEITQNPIVASEAVISMCKKKGCEERHHCCVLERDLSSTFIRV